METLTAVAAVLGALLGFVARSLWDWHLKRRSSLEEKRFVLLEKRLSEFYWPLYFRLQKDNVVWRLILARGSDDHTLKQIGHAIERNFILPNHQEAVALIESNFHLVGSDSELQQQLLAYIRHVAVYDALRTSGAEIDPLAVGEPWPQDLFPLIKSRTRQLQAEYESTLQTLRSRIRSGTGAGVEAG